MAEIEDDTLGDNVRLITFYLPQFHPIPENDEWWGKGFTEWRNVVNARPLFRGHYQPHLPADLGFYDLRVPEVREAQADLAREYGIYGFCYYHYWFNGRRLLERPLDEVLASGKPNFPFCLCWANENWTRAWDGKQGSILLAQNYSHEDDIAHIKSLVPYLRDERYIRVHGKPLLLVYRTELLPNPTRTAELWRETCLTAGVGDLYLLRVESFQKKLDPKSLGFDAAVEFPPLGLGTSKSPSRRLLVKAGILSKIYIENNIFKYKRAVDRFLNSADPGYLRFRTVTPSWDNTPRRTKNALILDDSNPEDYGAWLRNVVQETKRRCNGYERLVFINAWNEWGEGNHLEPDQKWGKAYLEATRQALTI
jgi:lipopolysaccharide biosynthesis protein